METAARLFQEQGFAATGVATILREAGVNSGSLYFFFKNKEDLLAAVLDQYRQWLQPVVLQPAEDETEDPIERIFTLLDWYRQGMEQSGCRLGCPIGNLALEVCDTYPAIREKVDLNFKGWTDGVRRWLESAAPRLPASTNLDYLAQFVLTVMEGGVMQSRARDSLAPFDASVAVLRDYLDRLLEAKKKEKE